MDQHDATYQSLAFGMLTDVAYAYKNNLEDIWEGNHVNNK